MASTSSNNSQPPRQRRFTAQQALDLILSQNSPDYPVADSDSGEEFARDIEADFHDSDSEFLPEQSDDIDDDDFCGRGSGNKRMRMLEQTNRTSQAAVNGN